MVDIGTCKSYTTINVAAERQVNKIINMRYEECNVQIAHFDRASEGSIMILLISVYIIWFMV